ncbi:MAG: aspartate/glutamate racemase family protein [candidate division NC10 bacterium]|nr:aspartate/glutamate racemase family protein [candidate division NC10 bacterium]
MPPRIALIHAVATAIPPIQHAFKEGWPEARLSNLLDDDLMPAYTREGGLTPHITERICALALYAARTGADGILFTCSVFPQAEDMAKQLVRVPLLKPDEAMIAAALEAGVRIGVVATNPPAAPAATAQLQAGATARGRDIHVVESVADGAFAIGNAGDAATHDRMVVEAALRIADTVDVICLAQVSMALARTAVQAKVNVPVLTSPETAVARLKALLSE